MTYGLEIVRSERGALRISRTPGTFVQWFGTAFVAVGVLFLVASPVALLRAGPAAAASILGGGVLVILIGRVIQRARQVLEIDPRTREATSAWFLSHNRVRIGSRRVLVGTRGFVKATRVRVSAGDEFGSRYLFAVLIAAASDAAPATMLHCDTADDADDVAARVGEALRIPAQAVPPAERRQE